MKRLLVVCAALACCSQSVWAQGYKPPASSGSLNPGACLTLANSDGTGAQKWCPNGANASKITNAAGTSLVTISSAGAVVASQGVTSTNDALYSRTTTYGHVYMIVGPYGGATYGYNMSAKPADGATVFIMNGEIEGTDNPLTSGFLLKLQNDDVDKVTFDYAGKGTFSDGVVATRSTAGGHGGTFTGNGAGYGVLGTGGATGPGGYFVAGGSGYSGVQGVGSGAGAGGTFASGTTATGATRQIAGQLTNGDLDLSSVANVDATVGVTEKLTPTNIPKAWANVTITNATPFVPTLVDGFNIASVSRIDANTLRFTIADDMANATYAPICQQITGSVGRMCIVTALAAGSFDCQCADAGGVFGFDSAGANTGFSAMVLGRQ